MTGLIVGGAALLRSANGSNSSLRGANQTGLRAANERLVLSLVRLHGQLSKGQIADLTGLTAQTASVIVRSLEADGYLVRGLPIRGKVGQPSVPMSLDPSGALFLGLRFGIGAEIVLADFVGRIRAEWRRDETLSLDAAIHAAATAAEHIRSGLTDQESARLQGIGIAMPGSMLDTMGESGLDRLATTFRRRLNLPVYIQDEAVAACSAELLYGLGGGVRSFLYIHVGSSVGGSLVRDGRLEFADSPTSPDVSRMLVPLRSGRLERLSALLAPNATLVGLSRDDIDSLARGIAYAAQAAASLVKLDACLIDGDMPEMTRKSAVQSVKARLQAIVGNLPSMAVREGTSERRSAALGAACLPLLDRFLMDADPPSRRAS